MTEIGKMLVFLGLLVAALGLVFMVVGRTNLPVGRLPGDIVYRGKHATFYFPLATSILISVVLTLVFYILGRSGIEKALRKNEQRQLSCSLT